MHHPHSTLTTHIQVRPGWDIPFNAIVVSIVITSALSLINLGSSVAFNAIISLATGAILSSYCLSIACVALKRIRKQELPPTRWSIGAFSLPCNIFAVAFLLLVFVISFFPLATPTTAAEMNYSSLIFGATIVVSFIYYAIWGRYSYTGPIALVKTNYD